MYVLIPLNLRLYKGPHQISRCCTSFDTLKPNNYVADPQVYKCQHKALIMYYTDVYSFLTNTNFQLFYKILLFNIFTPLCPLIIEKIDFFNDILNVVYD